MILYDFFNKLINITTPNKLRGGAVSITFDDQWHSAYCNALPLLDSYGFKSTWYISFANVGNYDNEYEERSANWEEICCLKKSNHEIASHTITHCDFDRMDIGSIKDELKESKELLMSKLDCPVDSFAYPFTRTGSLAGGPKAALSYYKSARGGEFGLNSLPLRRDNLFACKLYENKYNLEYFKALVDICAVENKWLIIYTHDVKENYSEYGCTPALFGNLLKYLYDKKIKIDTINSIVRQIYF